MQETVEESIVPAFMDKMNSFYLMTEMRAQEAPHFVQTSLQLTKLFNIKTNKEIHASIKKPTIIETIRLNRLRWFGYVQRTEENRMPKRLLYMDLGTTRLRGRPRNRWQHEMGEDGRIVGREGWQEKVHNREEWKKLLRMARNRCILHMPME